MNWGRGTQFSTQQHAFLEKWELPKEVVYVETDLKTDRNISQNSISQRDFGSKVLSYFQRMFLGYLSHPENR